MAEVTALAFAIAGGGSVLGQMPIPGGDLHPYAVPKYVAPLVKPPAMPQKSNKGKGPFKNKNKDMYKIAVRQFEQQILPSAQADGTLIPPTTVWSYGPENEVDPDGTGTHVSEGGHFFYPAFTIEATHGKTVQVIWSNGLVDGAGNPLPHIIPVDPTLHWANPIGASRDHRPPFDPLDPYWQNPYINFVDVGGPKPVPMYDGPVPIVTHVHGAHTYEQFDGYPEAWYLPASAYNDPSIVYPTGTLMIITTRSTARTGHPGHRHSNTPMTNERLRCGITITPWA